MTHPRLVLASTSRYRRELIARLGLEFEFAAPPYDEEAAQAALGATTPEHVVLTLARGKVTSLAQQFPDALILGGDQLAEIDGTLLGKPNTEERARAQLRTLAGRSHRLLSAIALHHPATGRTETAVSVHTLTVRALDDRAIADYVARDQPLDCSGSYKVESLGIALFEKLSGDDFTGIMGLPLTRVVTLLERFGVRVLGA